jgi:hypothetical protein
MVTTCRKHSGAAIRASASTGLLAQQVNKASRLEALDGRERALYSARNHQLEGDSIGEPHHQHRTSTTREYSLALGRQFRSNMRYVRVGTSRIH